MTTRLFSQTCLALAGLLALTPCVQAQTHKTKSHKPAPTHHASTAGGWQPTPALLKQLAAPYSLGDYTIRPPKGYDLEEKQDEQSTLILQISQWIGEKRTDDSQPVLSVFIISPQPGYHPPSDEEILAIFQKFIKADLKDYVQSPLTAGHIRDMDFTRAYWKGTDRESSQAAHGFTYTAVDSRIAILIIAQDIEPYNKTTLPLVEAAAETFQRQ
jgi:hypothetical protein